MAEKMGLETEDDPDLAAAQRDVHPEQVLDKSKRFKNASKKTARRRDEQNSSVPLFLKATGKSNTLYNVLQRASCPFLVCLLRFCSPVWFWSLQ